MVVSEDEGNEGILVVDKATGPTSHDVVAMARRALQIRRIGHCGTLDPLASGVLVLCIGRLTRVSEWISRGDKEYEATFHIGATSSTDDAQGEIQPTTGVPPPSRQRIEAAMAAFRGCLEQTPPAHSAVKVDGVRSYKRARRNEAVELAPRSVQVDRFEIVEFEAPLLKVRVECGKGTYIRSLARDLGAALGCGAYVETLRRLRIGTMHAAYAVSLESLQSCEDAGTLRAAFVEPRSALVGVLEPLELDEYAAQAFVHGQAVSTADVGSDEERAVFAGRSLLGIGRVKDGLVQPARVFAAPLAVVA